MKLTSRQLRNIIKEEIQKLYESRKVTVLFKKTKIGNNVFEVACLSGKYLAFNMLDDSGSAIPSDPDYRVRGKDDIDIVNNILIPWAKKKTGFKWRRESALLMPARAGYRFILNFSSGNWNNVIPDEIGGYEFMVRSYSTETIWFVPYSKEFKKLPVGEIREFLATKFTNELNSINKNLEFSYDNKNSKNPRKEFLFEFNLEKYILTNMK